MKEDGRQLLNEDQRRALSARLGKFEREICEFEMLLAGTPPRGALFERTNNLTRKETLALRAMFAEVHARLEILRNRFDLMPQREDARRRLLGYSSIAWAMLEDLHAAKLKGFGAVAPTLALALDPEIDELLEIIERIKSLLA